MGDTFKNGYDTHPSSSFEMLQSADSFLSEEVKGPFGIYLAMYKDILLNVIEKVMRKGHRITTTDTLVMAMVRYINDLDLNDIGTLAAVVETNQNQFHQDFLASLESIENIRRLKTVLCNPEQITKYLSVLMSRANEILKIISIFGTKVTDVPIMELLNTNREFNLAFEYKLKNYKIRDIVNELYLPTLRSVLNNCDGAVSFKSFQSHESEFVEIHKNFRQNFESVCGGGVLFEVQEMVKYSYHNLSKLKDFVVHALKGDLMNAEKSANAISKSTNLRSYEHEQPLSFAFHAAIKASMMSKTPIDISSLFGDISVNDLMGTRLFGKLSDAEENLLEEDYEDDNNVELEEARVYLSDTLIASLSLDELLNHSILYDKGCVRLNTFWENFIQPLNLNTNRVTELLMHSITNNKHIFFQNNVDILNWHREKLQSLGVSKKTFLSHIASSWLTGVDHGGGIFYKFLKYNRVKTGLNMEESQSPQDMFSWFYNMAISTEPPAESRDQLKIWEVAVDLSMRTGSVDHLSKALDGLLLMTTDFRHLVGDTFSFSRVVEASVITNHMHMLNYFWERVSAMDNDQQIQIKRRAVLDSTFGFHEAVRDGNLKMVKWIWSKINEIPKEPIIGHNGYKYELLYGLDSFGYDQSKQYPVRNAVFSQNVETLDWVVSRMKLLNDDLNTVESINALEHPEKRRGAKNTLVRDLYQAMDNLGYIPVLNNNMEYVEKLFRSTTINGIQKASFVEDVFRSAINLNNVEMLDCAFNSIPTSRKPAVLRAGSFSVIRDISEANHVKLFFYLWDKITQVCSPDERSLVLKKTTDPVLFFKRLFLREVERNANQYRVFDDYGRLAKSFYSDVFTLSIAREIDTFTLRARALNIDVQDIVPVLVLQTETEIKTKLSSFLQGADEFERGLILSFVRKGTSVMSGVQLQAVSKWLQDQKPSNNLAREMSILTNEIPSDSAKPSVPVGDLSGVSETINRKRIHEYATYDDGPSTSKQCAGIRKKRDSAICVDSRDEESISERGRKEKRLRDLFHSNKMVDTYHVFEELVKISNQLSAGQAVETVPETVLSKIKDLDLDEVEPEVRNIVRKLRAQINNEDEFKAILRRSGFAKKIGKAAETVGLAYTIFLVGKHLAAGDVEGLSFDALNLWVMPKLGEKISAQILSLSDKYGSSTLRAIAPIIGRSVGNLAAFWGLSESINALSNAKDSVDVKIAELNIATNSIFIAADIPAIITETMSGLGISAGIVGEFAGPFGAAVSVGAIVVSQFVEAHLQLEKIETLISLTSREEHELYWDFFLSQKIPDNLQRDMEAKNIYHKFVTEIVEKFKDVYDRIALSLPAITVTKEDYVSDVRSNGLMLPVSTCTIDQKITHIALDFGCKTEINNAFYVDYDRLSRMLPSSIVGFQSVCGPVDSDVVEEVVSSKPLFATVDFNCPDLRLKTAVEKLYLTEYPEYHQCTNAILYKNKPSTSFKTLFYISNHEASVVVLNKDNVEVIFNGARLAIGDSGVVGSGRTTKSRYHFTRKLTSCEVTKEGTNFFYTKNENFECDLGRAQRNVIVTTGNFTDFKNANAIIGSEQTNNIVASYSGYVDGKGGNDVISLKHFAAVKAYYGDTVFGTGLVLLPLDLSDIMKITMANSLTSVYGDGQYSITASGKALLKTTDDLFITPIRVDETTGLVTSLQVVKHVSGDVDVNVQLHQMYSWDNKAFKLTKQLYSRNCHITVSDTGHHVFYTDEQYRYVFWETIDEGGNMYVVDGRGNSFDIKGANGVLDLSRLNSEYFKPEARDDGTIEFHKDDVKVRILPHYAKLYVTFNGKKYYALKDGKLKRAHCTHELKVTHKRSVEWDHLPNHINCFSFESGKVLFFRVRKDLLLITDKAVLSINNYFSSVIHRWHIAVKLNNGVMIKPTKFQNLANSPTHFRYYLSESKELKIFHNQPTNKNAIGLVDMMDKSILNSQVTLAKNSLTFSFGDTNFVAIENWDLAPEARNVMFSFKDGLISNTKCIITTCEPHEILAEYNTVKSSANAKSEQVDEDATSKRYRRHDEKTTDVTKRSFLNDIYNSGLTAIKGFMGNVTNGSNALTLENMRERQEQTTSTGVSSRPTPTDVNSSILLLDTLVRKITGRKYVPSPRFNSTFDDQANALNIIEKFENILEETCDCSGVNIDDLNFEPVEAQMQVLKNIRNGERYKLKDSLTGLVFLKSIPVEKVNGFSQCLINNLEALWDI